MRTTYIEGTTPDGTTVMVQEDDEAGFYNPFHWYIEINGEQQTVQRSPAGISRLRDGGSTTLKLLDGRTIHQSHKLHYRRKPYSEDRRYPPPTLDEEPIT